jgi:hypothetical protein
MERVLHPATSSFQKVAIDVPGVSREGVVAKHRHRHLLQRVVRVLLMVSIRTYLGHSTFIYEARNLLRAHMHHVMIPLLSSNGSTIAEVPEPLMFMRRVVLQLAPCLQSRILIDQHRDRSPYPCAADANQRQPNHMLLLTIDSTSDIRSCIFSSTVLRSANAV